MKNGRFNNLVLRADIIRSIRDFFQSEGFFEVETPQLIPANAPEEHIEPIGSCCGKYLQTSPELCMKRLLCRGYNKIFQISHCWRSGERGARHLQEFTILEWYRSNSDYTALMTDCERLLAWVTAKSGNCTAINYQGNRLAMDCGICKISVSDAYQEFGKLDMNAAVADGSFDEIMVSLIEPGLKNKQQPVILMDYPAEKAALARLKPDRPEVAERFELYAGGLELANGFSELNDADEQRYRFLDANRIRRINGNPPLPLPLPFLEELETMPPSAGIAMGIDRLVMLFADAASIDEVIAFTPEEL